MSVNVPVENIRDTVQGARDDISIANSMVIYNKRLTQQSKVDALFDYLRTASIQIEMAMAEIKEHTTYHQNKASPIDPFPSE